MNTISTSLLVAACIFSGGVGGLYLHRLLPREHLTRETLDGHRQVERPPAWPSRGSRISALDDDAPRPALCWLSLSRRAHQLCGLAVFPVPIEPAHGWGDAGGSRHLGHIRDDPAVGPEIRSGIRQPHPSASPPPRR